MRLLDRVELGGVKFLVKERLASISDAVQSSDARDYPLDKPVLAELGKAVTRVVRDGNVQLLKRIWSEVPFGAQVLQNSLVNRAHPLCASSWHDAGFDCGTHRDTGVEVYATFRYKSTYRNTLLSVFSTASY